MTGYVSQEIAMSELYRCGWCGQPTNKDGDVLTMSQIGLVSDLARWDGAESVHGECCRESNEPRDRREICTRDMAIDACDPSLEGQWV